MFDVAYFLPSDLLFNTCPPSVLKKKEKEFEEDNRSLLAEYCKKSSLFVI